MTATEDTTTEFKDETDSVEPPSREQIDLVFATVLKTVDSETEGYLADAVAEMIATYWRTVRQLKENGNLSEGGVDAEKIAEEWL